MEERRTKKITLVQNLSSSENDSLFDQIAINSLLSSFEGRNSHFQRKVCRFYSETFNTPLPTVYKMDFHEVLTDFYEYRFDRLMESEDGREQLYDMITKIIKPELVVEEKEELKKFEKEIEKEENERLSKKMSLMDYLRNAQRKSSKKLSADFKVIEKSKEEIAKDLEKVKENKIPVSISEESKSLNDEEEVYINFEDESLEFSSKEISEMSDEKLSKMFNKD